ncbi:UxaA family hydrolase [Campylobacter jejuni]|uniref:Altronate dehydratase n=1 Tax=Campylobacter jejuni TaxID=197 RepID=A0A690UZX5_CAMJU|nr:UxaA family hydrolase [Campylobacter jejuni]EAJ5193460.1 altronate dehydratase [Campylobacter jejuni]EAK0572849.1 altronate dehydratase [Campylobacter jejuni]EDP7702121.1 altronate dehydratase [Campylobacter jejuni]EDP8234575.1 altronate dehydratase [Campylobacter jejuni]EFV4333983.1 UxaA family hydrolase [Campylobacter jejuni]
MKKIMGYRREDGKFGLRNKVIIIPSVHCANKVCENIARKCNGAVYINHQHGCSQLEFDALQTRDVLIGHGSNANVFGVLIIGLGCEVIRVKAVAEKIKEATPYKKVEYLVIQECGGSKNTIENGIKIVNEMLESAAKLQKSEGDFSDLVLGTECGGSDSYSGLSANPALGSLSDFVIDEGGAVILAETTELIGCETILTKRAKNDEIAKKVYDKILAYENLVKSFHADIRGANPSPGNIAGGLSTIEEKSLGCVYKAGTRTLMDVIDYAKPVVSKGLTFMNTPGNDIEQLSAMVAGGANICVFTTGRGTPTGSAIVPTIKMSSNTFCYENMNDAIDINAGSIIDGVKTKEEVRDELIELIVRISDGELVKAEINEQNDFSVWRLATTC